MAEQTYQRICRVIGEFTGNDPSTIAAPTSSSPGTFNDVLELTADMQQCPALTNIGTLDVRAVEWPLPGKSLPESICEGIEFANINGMALLDQAARNHARRIFEAGFEAAIRLAVASEDHKQDALAAWFIYAQREGYSI